MTFRREIHNDIRFLGAKERVDRLAVADIAVDKMKARNFCKVAQRFIVARIRQRIDAKNLRVLVRLHHIVDEIAADKAGTAGHKILHASSSP